MRKGLYLILAAIITTGSFSGIMPLTVRAETDTEEFGVYYDFDPEATQEPYEYTPIEQEDEVINGQVYFPKEDGEDKPSGENKPMRASSSSANTALWNSLLADQFGEKYLSPYAGQKDGQNITGDTNRLTIEETDLTIPGKNGMDVNIRRVYDNQYYNTSYYGYNGSAAKVYSYRYIYEFAASTGTTVYIGFATQDEFYIDMCGKEFVVGRLPASPASEFMGDDGEWHPYYLYETVRRYKSSAEGITLTNTSELPYVRDPYDEKEETYKISSRKLLPNRSTLGNGWTLLLPEASMDRYEYDKYNYTDYTDYNLDYVCTFRDIDGNINTFDYYPYFREYKNETKTVYRPGFSGTSNMYLTFESYYEPHYLDEEQTVKYNFIVHDSRGIDYYMYSRYMETNPTKAYHHIYLSALSDNYGNTIKYEYDENYKLTKIIDTYGREITCNMVGNNKYISYYDSEAGATRTISYDLETLPASALDNDSLIKQKNVKRFKVTNANGETTIYDAREAESMCYYSNQQSEELFKSAIVAELRTNTGIVDNYNIERIIYPSGAESRYKYTRLFKTNEQAKVACGRYAVQSAYDIIDGVVSNNREYSYGTSREYYDKQVRSSTSVDETNSSSNGSKRRLYTPYGQLSHFSESGYMISPSKSYTYNGYLLKQSTEGDGITSQGKKYTYRAYFPDLLEDVTIDDKRKISYVYWTNDRGVSGIPSRINVQYKSGSGFVTDYSIVTTLTEDKKAVEYERVIKNNLIKSQKKYEYNSEGERIREYVWTGDTNGDGALDENDEVIVYNTTNAFTDNNSRRTIEYIENVTDADGLDTGTVSAQYDFDTLGNPVKRTDPLGNVTQIQYDAVSRPVKYTFANGAERTVEYTPTGEYAILTDETGRKIKYTYDEMGKETGKYLYNGDTEILLESRIYDAAERLAEKHTYKKTLSDTDLHIKEKYTYDASGKLLKTETYENDTLVYTDNISYTFGAKTTSRVGADGTVSADTKEYYDNNKNVIKTEAISGSNKITATNTYDYLDRLITSTDAMGNTTTYEYDVLGNLVKVTDPKSKSETSVYDMAGRKISQTDKNGKTTTYTYDKLGRNIKTESPILEETAQTLQYYDKNSNLVKSKVKKELLVELCYIESYYSYDNMNRVVWKKEKGIPVMYSYDLAGRTTQMTVGMERTEEEIPENAKTNSYEYDVFGNLKKITDGLGNSEEYVNYIDGTQKSKTDKNGNVIENVYGVFGLKERSCGEISEITAYDGIGRITGKASYNGDTLDDEILYSYDNFGRLVSETNNGVINNYTYNANSAVTGHTVLKNNTEMMSDSYTYDNLGRVTQKVSDGVTSSYAYDDNGNLTSKQVGGITTEIAYNNAGLPSSMVNKRGETVLNSFAYGYDYAGNRISETDSVSEISASYTYDRYGRIYTESINGNGISEQWEYIYDCAGNRQGKSNLSKSTAYGYDAVSRLVQFSDIEWDEENNIELSDMLCTYDSNGNLTSSTTDGNEDMGVEAETETYTYDVFNRLTGYRKNDGPQVSYTYRADGKRKSKIVNGVETEFVWDGDNMIMSGTEKYSYGVGGIEFSDACTYVKDIHGNVISGIDGEGNILSTYNYDSFGNVLKADGSMQTDPFRYCGEYTDTESGLIYLRNRYYDPSIGRFITEDPIRDGSNWYIYCDNNPVMYVDPSGLIPSVMEAALMAEHIYTWNKSSDKEKRIISGWRLVDTWYGREDMKMGIYIRNNEDWKKPSEYVIAFKGTTWYEPNEWKNNIEQLLSTKSADMWDAINYSRGFVSGKSQEITFVGHSKGGAEAASAAVATNKNAMIFNPATSNLSAYGLSSSSYTASMTAYIVKGDILNATEGWFSKPIDKAVYLPQQHGGNWYEGWKTSIYQSIQNHLMDAVKSALRKAGY